MAAEVTTELKIPDLWYDFYATLIPGLVFIAAFRYYSLGYKYEPSGTELVILLIVAYVTGILVNPFSALLVTKIYNFLNPLRNNDDDRLKNWVEDIQGRLGRESRDSLILSKMHGEVNLFIQLFLLTLIFGVTLVLLRAEKFREILPKFKFNGHELNWYYSWVVILIFAFFCFGAACSVVKRQVKRAKNYALMNNYHDVINAIKEASDSAISETSKTKANK